MHKHLILMHIEQIWVRWLPENDGHARGGIFFLKDVNKKIDEIRKHTSTFYDTIKRTQVVFGVSILNNALDGVHHFVDIINGIEKLN